MKLILYSKPGCHLCEGLQEKIEQIQTIPIELEVRDITTNEVWYDAYQFEIPVLFRGGENPAQLPRVSPRASVAQVEQMLRQHEMP